MTIYSEEKRQTLVNQIVSQALVGGCRTQFVGTTDQSFQNIAIWLQKELSVRHVGVIFDARTDAIAHNTLLPILHASGVQYTALGIEDPSPHQNPICSTQLGEQTAQRFGTPLQAILSVGGGTLTDTGKIAAHALQIPTIAIATAASMNGFTSGLAATLDNGVKLTQKVPAPIAVWSLPKVLQHAPPELNAAGLGDLLSKPISSADWRLSHLLNDAPWDTDVVRLLDAIQPFSSGIASGVAAQDPNALAQLFSALCLTGIAMQFATPGAQASGAEHLISHYFDMIAGSGDFGHTATHHGAQVAVGCMVALAAWEFAQHALQENRPMGACPPHAYDADNRDAWITHHFRSIAPAIAAMHARNPVTLEDIARRRQLLQSNGIKMLRDASQHLPTHKALAQQLQEAGCPITFAALGIEPTLAENCLRYAPWVRARYTIFHLLIECGWYDAFVRHFLSSNI